MGLCLGYRVMCFIHTDSKVSAKTKDSRTDVNHVGVSNALSSLSQLFFYFSTVSKRLNCVCVCVLKENAHAAASVVAAVLLSLSPSLTFKA
jgi:hypothetical protein